MAVYIEYAIIDNLVFDGILFYAVKRTLRLACPPWRLALCILVAVALGVLLPLASLPSLASLAIKAAFPVVICLPLSYGEGKKRYFWSILLLFAYTFVLGGVAFAFNYALTDFISPVGFARQLPIGLYLFTLFVAYLLAANVVRYVNSARAAARLGGKATLTVMNLCFTLSSSVDSGNCLTYRDLPVCFLFDRAVCKQLKRRVAQLVTEGKVFLHRIPFSTLSGNDTATALLGEVTFNGVSRQCYIAFAARTAQSQLLLHTSFIGENDEITHSA